MSENNIERETLQASKEVRNKLINKITDEEDY